MSVVICDLSNQVSDEQLIEALKAVFKKKRLSMRSIAKATGTPYRTVQNYFSGESRIPASFLMSVCIYAGVEAEYLVPNADLIQFNAMYDALFPLFERFGILPDYEVVPSEGGGEHVDASRRIALARRLTMEVCERYEQERQRSIEGFGMGLQAKRPKP